MVTGERIRPTCTPVSDQRDEEVFGYGAPGDLDTNRAHAADNGFDLFQQKQLGGFYLRAWKESRAAKRKLFIRKWPGPLKKSGGQNGEGAVEDVAGVPAG